jgi:hypothetical protein
MDKKKRLKKIESLKKQKEKHRGKIDSYKGKNPYLIAYWEKEIERFDAEISEEMRKLDE